MKKIYQLLLVAGIANSLTSCSHGNYAGNQQALVQLSSQQLAPSAPSTDLATMALVVAPAASPNAPEATSSTLVEVGAQHVNNCTSAPSKLSRPGLGQQLMLKKVNKQLAKIQATHQNTSQVQQTASKAGKAGFVILVGAVILLIGGLIGGTNIVATIGGAILIVGLILLVIALIKG